jgi:putative restriction endonuclease
MAHCVFVHRSDSIYDDSPAVQYQFPSQYLSRALPSVGSWIVYLEPTKVPDSRGYFATAKIQEIIKDPNNSAMYLAIIERGSYLEFPVKVRFSSADGPVERGLLNEAGRLSGRAQAAVRPLSDGDFRRILDLGFANFEASLPRLVSDDAIAGFDEEQAPFEFERPRDRIGLLTSRIVRDRVFRSLVLRAYEERCAVSGLKLINGGGRAEVNAAHIRPVEKDGPDIVSNGIALCGTAHWMFDRGLISLADDLQILVSRQVNDEVGVREFINKSGYASKPRSTRDWPHPAFLRWHRENCFKT